MGRFERSNDKNGKRDFSGPRRRSSSNADSFDDYNKGKRGFDRGPRSPRREGGDVEMTKVTCSSCGIICEVPFKPRSSKPLFCDSCFKKEDKDSSRDRGYGSDRR